MQTESWELKDGAVLSVESVAKIAEALKALSAYTCILCEEPDDENPAALLHLVQQGLNEVDNLFNY